MENPGCIIKDNVTSICKHSLALSLVGPSTRLLEIYIV